MSKESRFEHDIEIHVEMLVDEEMRAHAFADTSHDLAFQIFRLLGGYRRALEEAASLRQENKELKKMFHDLTPGGSEFVNDPKRCVAFIEDIIYKQNKTLRQRIAELEAEIERMKCCWNCNTPYLANAMKSCVPYTVAWQQCKRKKINRQAGATKDFWQPKERTP